MLLARICLVLSLLLVPTVVLAGCGEGDDDAATPTSSKESSEDAREESSSGDEDDGPGIVPGESIAGVQLDAELEDVEATLGEADRREEFDNEISGATDERLVWEDPAVEVTMAPIQPFEDRETATTLAVQLSTTDDSLRTPRGIGIGSSRADVEETYQLVECDSGDIVICRLPAPGNVVTDFFVEDDVVTRIVVGRILD